MQPAAFAAGQLLGKVTCTPQSASTLRKSTRIPDRDTIQNTYRAKSDAVTLYFAMFTRFWNSVAPICNFPQISNAMITISAKCPVTTLMILCHFKRILHKQRPYFSPCHKKLCEYPTKAPDESIPIPQKHLPGLPPPLPEPSALRKLLHLRCRTDLQRRAWDATVIAVTMQHTVRCSEVFPSMAPDSGAKPSCMHFFCMRNPLRSFPPCSEARHKLQSVHPCTPMS